MLAVNQASSALLSSRVPKARSLGKKRRAHRPIDLTRQSKYAPALAGAFQSGCESKTCFDFISDAGACGPLRRKGSMASFLEALRSNGAAYLVAPRPHPNLQGVLRPGLRHRWRTDWRQRFRDPSSSFAPASARRRACSSCTGVGSGPDSGGGGSLSGCGPPCEPRRPAGASRGRA